VIRNFKGTLPSGLLLLVEVYVAHFSIFPSLLLHFFTVMAK